MMRRKAEQDRVPQLRCKYFREPLLRFASGKEHVDPKTGLARWGPLSYDPMKRHPNRVRIGFLGTSETIERAEQWISVNASGVPGDEKHPDFPGCAADRGFHTALDFNRDWNEPMTQTDIRDVLQPHARKDKFDALLNAIEAKFQLFDRKDFKPDYVVIALPESLSNYFTVEYHDKTIGMIHRDLRRAIKARLMKYKIPTQLIDEKTIAFEDDDHPAKIAWNFFTGLYFKAGGTPWGPTGLHTGYLLYGHSLLSRTRLKKSIDVHEPGSGV